jgi:hypothetical protein
LAEAIPLPVTPEIPDPNSASSSVQNIDIQIVESKSSLKKTALLSSQKINNMHSGAPGKFKK